MVYPWRPLARIAARKAALGALTVTGDPLAAWFFRSGRSDVYATFERIRARGPVFTSRSGLRAVTSRPLCGELVRHPDLGVRLPGNREFRTEPLATDFPPTLSRSFLTLDPPDHTRLRRIAAPGFRPATIRSWRPRLEAIAADLADRAARTARHEGAVDLVAAFATPFPIAVIAAVLGVEDVDAERFGRIGALVGQAQDGIGTPAQAAAVRAGGQELEVMFTRLLDQRAAEPRDDVLSLIAAARSRGEASVTDALEVASLLLLAGFETTVNLIGNAVSELQGQPSLWRQLVEAPDLAPAVVEEALRHSTSVQATARIAHRDTEVAGTAVPAGSVVLLLLAAANRDPDVYARPGVFDPHRTGEPEHLAFSSGEHYCLGAALARMEGDVGLRALTAAMPGLRTVPGARLRPGRVVRGYERLPGVLA